MTPNPASPPRAFLDLPVGRGPRARLLTLLAVLALVLAAAGCRASDREATPEGATPAPEGLAISGACAGAETIEPGQDYGAGDWAAVEPAESPNCFTLTAASSDATGIAADTSFTLESTEPLDVEALGALLVTDPPIELEIVVEEASGGAAASGGPWQVGSAHAQESHRYTVKPKAPLDPGALIRFKLLGAPDGAPVQSWAFQTQAPLAVVQTLPADRSAQVPVDTGIELTFSHDGVTGVEERVAIEPAVEGGWTVNKRTATFVPAGLAPNTLYTVRVDPALGIGGSDRTLGEPFVFQFETGSEVTASDSTGAAPTLQFYRPLWESAISAAPLLSVFSTSGGGEDNPFAGQTLPITAYRYRDRDAFLAALDDFAAIPTWAGASRSAYAVDTNDPALSKVADFDATLQPIGQFGELVVPFPEPLPAGYYLVNANHDGEPVQAWLQVTDAAAYAAVSEGKTLVWVNDAATGKPVEGATIEVAGGGAGDGGSSAAGGTAESTSGSTADGATDADGVALVDTPAGLVSSVAAPWPPGAKVDDATGTLILRTADGEAVLPLSDTFQSMQGGSGVQEFGERGDANRFWRYLYTDRTIYRPTDTLNFWGVARPRENPPESQDLSVELVASSASDMPSVSYAPALVARAPVQTGPSGTYIGKLDLRGAAPGFYNLVVKAGDVTVSQLGIEVQDFVKPAYKIDVTPAREAIYAGDRADFAVAAAFFEGSPVPGLELTYNGDTEGTLTTDATGGATIPYTAPIPSSDRPNHGDYRWAYVYTTPTLAEEASITGQGSVRVFSSAASLRASARAEGESGLVEGVVRAVDLDRVNSGEAENLDDYRGAPIADRAVTARIEEIRYDRRETGQSYDPITKRTDPIYTYDEVRTPVGSFEGTTDAEGRFSIPFPVQKDRSYEIIASVQDDSARTTSQALWVYTGQPNMPSEMFTLERLTEGPYAIGDDVAMELRRGGASLGEGEQGRFLFFKAMNDIREYAIGDSARHDFEFDESHVPNTNVLGVWFDGKGYREARYPVQAKLDQATRALSIAVSPEREDYEPGEEATLNVEVKDAEGRPAQAEVLLSAVDEAIFRMQGAMAFDNLGILDGLYRTVSSGLLGTYASHQQPLGMQGAEGGGGGGGRDNFKDTALFERVTTGPDGKASVKMALPDNLTSWRVSALGVTDDLYAGSGGGAVPVGLPVFADVALNQSYVADDEPVLRLRAYGTALEEGEDVAFEVDAPTLLAAPLSAAGKAFTGVDLPLGELKLGEHPITVTVKAGDQSDSLVRTTKVLPSRLTRTETAFSTLGPGDAFTVPLEIASDRLVEVAFTDQNRGRYNAPLQDIAATWSDRLDAAIARDLARGLLAEYYGASAVPPQFRVGNYQTDDGGLALLPYGSTDLGASIRAAAAAPDAVGRERLAGYLVKLTDDPDETRERVTEALWGLAALGQPILPAVQSLATATELSPIEQLHLGLAAAELGDTATAGVLYRGLIEAHGQGLGGAVRLNVGADQADILNATSLGAVLGAMLGDDLAPAMFEYTLDNTNSETLNVLEQVTYLEAALPRLASTPARFTYTLDGVSREATVGGSEALALMLSGDQLKALDVQVADGQLGVGASALVPLDPDSIQADPELSILRRIVSGSQAEVTGAPAGAAASGEAGADGPVDIAESDLVRVTLDYTLGPKAVDGCYQVSDLLPSGLKPVTQPYQRGITFVEEGTEADYPYAVDGQRVSFCVDRGREGKPLTYYARVSGKGAFAAEPALIQAQRAPASLNVSGTGAVEIR